mgnify:FL=1
MNFLNPDYQRAFATMGESGIDWIDTLFKVCVMILVDLADLTGMTYEGINIWIFLIIWPFLTLFLIVWVFYLLFRNRRLKKKISQ